jgi:ribonuclease H / adenosylcobalamin/alpha-ribazole phosphatase
VSRPDSAGPDSVRAPRLADQGEPTVLLLIRHGRTPLTEQRRSSGRGGADPGLSEAGRGDAARMADLVARWAGPGGASDGGPDVGPVSAVICSPLARTRETAQVLADRLGLAAAPDGALAEIAFGEWDGLTYGEVEAGWPDLLRAWQGSMTLAPPGGESLAGFAERVRSARAGIVAGHPGGTVAVVTHTTPVRVVVQEALDAGPAALWRTRIDPCSVTVVRYWRDGGIEVVAVNRLP